MQENLSIQNLDHLGIIAGIVDDIGLVEVVNELVGEDPREQVSAGVVVKAMILNGLGFVSAPLYLFGQFFVGKPTEHLLGRGVLPKHLNDDRIGRVLDQLYLVGVTAVFMAICMRAARRYGVAEGSAHLDATSMSVQGAYLDTGGAATDDGTVPIAITHGYSRDHRPDLKQFVLNLVCWGDGDIPAFISLGDGNQSDKASFACIMQQFQQQWDMEGVQVADSALYSADNLAQMDGLVWISRVPLTVGEANALLDAIDESAFVASTLEGYRIAQVCSQYGGVRQRWLVVESADRKASDLQQQGKRLASAGEQARRQLDKLKRQSFACAADAQQAAHQLDVTLKLHRLASVTIAERPYYQQPGRPAKDALPSAMRYLIEADIEPKAEELARLRRRSGRFILATNALASSEFEANSLSKDEPATPMPLTADDILQHYKAQQGTERGFRFLKDPLFFTASVFLHSPERIMALAMVMGLCLLVYNLGQRQLRRGLEAAGQAVPNQLGKPTQTPTLRWIFQSFMAIHLVTMAGQKQVVGLNGNHRLILRFLGSASQSYYLLC
ncbi:MAG: IS1634 family transposase [Elainellaceae cyanobacterium]